MEKNIRELHNKLRLLSKLEKETGKKFDLTPIITILEDFLADRKPLIQGEGVG